MQTVLITGASRGLGREFCRYFLSRCDRVLACCRDCEAALRDDEIRASNGELTVLQLDVALEESINNLAKNVSGLGIKIDLLINNAGISIDEKIGNWSMETFEQTFRVNSIGPALVTQALDRCLAANAKVIFLSSGLGSIEERINPDGPYDSYSMSKVALSMLCRRLAAKRTERSPIFAALNPGWVRTDMGGLEAPTSVEEAVLSMAKVIESLDSNSSGSFLDSDGNEIAW